MDRSPTAPPAPRRAQRERATPCPQRASRSARGRDHQPTWLSNPSSQEWIASAIHLLLELFELSPLRGGVQGARPRQRDDDGALLRPARRARVRDSPHFRPRRTAARDQGAALRSRVRLARLQKDRLLVKVRPEQGQEPQNPVRLQRQQHRPIPRFLQLLDELGVVADD